MKHDSIFYKTAALVYKLTAPIIDPINILKGLYNYLWYIRDLWKYKKHKISLLDLHPILNDKTTKTAYDPQYYYQSYWAFSLIHNSKVTKHVDIGSQLYLLSLLSIVTKVEFVDIRPPKTNQKNLKIVYGDILKLPYKKESVKSLSCLHVAEHIGLGRYGDALDPNGTLKACNELSRILSKGGNLYFSIPIGKQKTCFNAHRIFSPKSIINYFDKLKLISFSAIDDNGEYIENANMHDFDNATYSCGLFHFQK